MTGTLPDNWTTARLSEICQINPRGRPELSDDSLVSFVPMAAVDEHSGSIVAAETRALSEVRTGFTPFRDGDVLFAKITPCMENGKAAIARDLANGHGYGSTEFHVLRPSPLVLAGWLFALVRTEAFRRAATSTFQGAVGQQRVPASYLEGFRIPLPPLSEQDYIVKILQEAEAIRCLRAQAEAKATKLIPSIINTLEDVIASTRLRPLGELFSERPNYGTMIPADESAGADGIVCLRVGNIQNDKFDFSDTKYVQRGSINERRHIVQAGDIILARAIASEEHLGKALVISTREAGFAFDSHLMRIRVRGDRILPEFLQSYLRSPRGRHAFLRQTRQSAVQFNVNGDEIARVLVPEIPMEIQRNLVVQLDEVARHRSDIATAIAGEDRLAASLSAHAFSGELTREWREQHASTLATEARRRDEALKSAGVSAPAGRRLTIPEMEHLFSVPTDGIFADLNREQRELYRQIERSFGGVLDYARYFTAEQLAQDPGPLHRHPQAIEAHLAVFATRGILIPVSRPRHDTTRAPFAACYRLPVNPSRSGRELDGADETPAEFDDIRLMTLERIRTTITGGATSE